jgi:hypothetical protein
MKKALGLLGEYSDIWKEKNNTTDWDIFMISYEYNIGMEQATKYKILKFPDISVVHQQSMESFLFQDQTYHCIELMKEEYDYTTIFFMTYNTVVYKLPNDVGVFDATPIPVYTHVPHFTILTDKAVKVDGLIECLNTTSLELRQKLWERLYNNRVMDYKHMTFLKKDKVIFLIPSVIHVSENSFNYQTFGTRSLFTGRERFEQTLKQVQAIHAAGHTALILEGSELSFHELDQLTKYAIVIFFTRDVAGNKHANSNPNKSCYEIYTLKCVLSLIKCKWVFKFGGRYRFLHNFDLSRFLKSTPVFKVVDKSCTYTNESIIDCIMYSIPKSYIHIYIRLLEKMLHSLELDPNQSVENIIYKFIEGDYERLTHFNLVGKDAIYAQLKIV